MMGKGVQRFEPLYDDCKHMPGIFEPGSDLDHSLIETRKKSPSIFGQDRDTQGPQLGARRRHRKLNFETSIIHTDAAPVWVRQCEVIWLVTLDTRIRFCRWLLKLHSFPHDRDEVLIRSDGGFGWTLYYDNFDPNEYVKLNDIFRYFLPRLEAEPYYCMKFLAHFHRVEQIVDGAPLSGDLWVALGREFYLMGELWSEISFLSEHLQNLVFGQKQQRHLDAATAQRTGEFAEHTPRVLEEMHRLVGMGHTIKNAARIAAGKGIGSSEGANRNLYYRHSKNSVTRP